MLRCPNCKNELIRFDNTYKCINNHSFDISRNGYINLLLSNKKASKIPGDNKEMVLARTNFLQTDKYNNLRLKLNEIIKDSKKENLLDVACGEGYYTNFFEINKKIGIDISKEAIIQASKSKKCQYLIGSLYDLPILDESVEILLNCFAPISVNEFNRVLKKDGLFIRVLPNLYHLYELKEVVYEKPYLNKLEDTLLEGFELINTFNVDGIIELKNIEINNLFKMTPYYYKSPIEGSNKLKSLDYLKTRTSFLIYVYKKL